MHFLEHVCEMFLECFPTVNRTLVRHLNRVLRVKRGQGRGIAVVCSQRQIF
jgi:hypothetical protein